MVAECGWDIPVGVNQGYWYFYSLGLLGEVDASNNYYIQSADLEEYLLDMSGRPPPQCMTDIVAMRSFQIDPGELRWPLMTLDYPSLQPTLTAIISAKGCFEPRGELVQHWHIEYRQICYLLVRHLDDGDHEVMLLGSSRDKGVMSDLIARLRGEPQ